MDWQPVEVKWRELGAAVHETWNRLTDDDLSAIDGRRDELCLALRRLYGYAEAQAQNAIDDFVDRIIGVGAGGYYVPEHP